LHILDHAGEEDLAVRLRHVLDQRDPAVIRGPAAGGHAALAERWIAYRVDRRAGGLGAADMRHLNALYAHIQEPQDKGGVEAGGANDRRDPGALSGHHRELHIAQVVGGVLHIDERGVEAGEPDELDDLWVGDTADMGAERETALAQDALDPVLLHLPLPRQPALTGRVPGWR